MSRRAVGVLVTRISWQEPIECGQQISFGSRASFHQGQSCRRMGHEHAHEPIAEIGAESFQFPRQIDYPRAGRVHIEFDRARRPIFCRLRQRPVTSGSARGRESQERSRGLHSRRRPNTAAPCSDRAHRDTLSPCRRSPSVPPRFDLRRRRWIKDVPFPMRLSRRAQPC